MIYNQIIILNINNKKKQKIKTCKLFKTNPNTSKIR